MAEQLVPTAITAVTPTALYATLRAAWRTLLGTEPSRASLLVLLAQWSLETENGARCMCWNLAGIKHVAGDGHDYACYATEEVLKGERVRMVAAFRAYDALEQGAADYLAELRARFGYAWAAVEAGDVADFAHRLKLRGYYTAPELEYSAGLVGRRKLLEEQIGPDTEPEIDASADEVLEAVRDERSVEGPVKGEG